MGRWFSVVKWDLHAFSLGQVSMYFLKKKKGGRGFTSCKLCYQVHNGDFQFPVPKVRSLEFTTEFKRLKNQQLGVLIMAQR